MRVETLQSLSVNSVLREAEHRLLVGTTSVLRPHKPYLKKVIDAAIKERRRRQQSGAKRASREQRPPAVDVAASVDGVGDVLAQATVATKRAQAPASTVSLGVSCSEAGRFFVAPPVLTLPRAADLRSCVDGGARRAWLAPTNR